MELTSLLAIYSKSEVRCCLTTYLPDTVGGNLFSVGDIAVTDKHQRVLIRNFGPEMGRN